MFEGCSWLPVVSVMWKNEEKETQLVQKKKNLQSAWLDWAVNREG